MRITLERSNLLKSLNHVHRVVERRNTIPILSNVLIDADVGGSVRVIELLSLPDRRGPPAEARAHYREVDGCGLDPKGQNTIGASPLVPDAASGDPEHRF